MKNPLELFSSVVSNVSISNDRVDLLSYSRDMWPKGQLQSFDGTFIICFVYSYLPFLLLTDTTVFWRSINH